jgi:uncharacterized repeat protein (TIGR02059 family)
MSEDLKALFRRLRKKDLAYYGNLGATAHGGSGGGGGNSPVVADTTAPEISSAVVPAAGTTLGLTYNENLLASGDGVPDIADYSLSAGGTAVTISAVSVSGAIVTLNLARTITSGETLSFNYTAGASGRVQDASNNIASDLASQAVTNSSTQTGDYAAVAVSFDGSNDYLSRGGVWSGASDGKQGIVSFWFNMQGGDGAANQFAFITQNAGTSARFWLTRNSSNKWVLNGRNNAGATILTMTSNAAYSTVSNPGWMHFLAAWDLATGVGQLYVSDASDLLAGPTLTNDTIAYNTGVATVTIGSDAAAASKLFAYISDLYINIATTLDISNSTNRRLFISAGGKPVDLGADGSTPTGSAPIVFLANPVASWETNLGGGGGFTENGALTAAASSPSD